jgi:uroporphyrinogen-III synthase
MPDVLLGFTVAVTAAGGGHHGTAAGGGHHGTAERDDLGARLERHGARVVLTQALRAVPLEGSDHLRPATRSLLDRAPDIVVVDTGAGLRGWIEAADGWGDGDELRRRLSAAYVVAQGPKASAAARAAGLAEAWKPTSDSLDGILDHLVRRAGHSGNGSGPLAGRRVAVVLQGEPQDEFRGGLAGHGADVVEVPVYRWGPPADPTPLRRLVDLISNRLVDAVTFTSAAAVASLLGAAGPAAETVLDALRVDVLAGCVGPVTAAPLLRHGVPALVPARPRLGSLAHALVEALPKRTRTLRVAGAELVLRGHAAVIDGVLKPLPPAQMAILKALASAPGKVLPRSQLLGSLPRGADEHAVEMAVARLRATLGGSGFIQTVVKRGYRLRVD